MALTTYTITIVNKNVAPVDVVGEGYKPIVVISPTGVTTPDTPYAEWVADNTSRLDGSVAIPAWKKLQYFILPAASKLVIATEISDEAVYYQGLVGKFENVDIKIGTNNADAPISTYALSIAYTNSQATVGTETAAPTVKLVTNGVAGADFSADKTFTISDETLAEIAADGKITAKAGSAGKSVVVTVTGTTTDGIAVAGTTTVKIVAGA